MGVGSAIATGVGSALQLGQGMSAKQAGQKAAQTGERQLGENEEFARMIGDNTLGAVNSSIGGLSDLAGQGVDLNSFDIGQTSNTQQQAIDNALQFGQNQRMTAREQMGTAFNQQSDQLDAALASRGLSRDSGVAAGALTGLLGQQGQQMSELNRAISEQQGNMALQAGQFDAQNALGLGQLGVQQTLGLNQQGIDLMGTQGNILGQLGNLGMAGVGNVLTNQQANMGRTADAAASAGAGKGAGIGGAAAGLQENAGHFNFGPKTSGAGAGTGAGSQHGGFFSG